MLNNHYHYVWKDWFNGKKYRVSLSDATKHKEDHDINEIKNNTFQIKMTIQGFNIFFFLIAETKNIPFDFLILLMCSCEKKEKKWIMLLKLKMNN